jgi:hypothetical protein
MADGKAWLLAAGTSSIVAALLHIACIAGGPKWYRALGAGEQFASAAARGAWFPAVITLGISGIIGVWALYAFSAAGMIPALPFRRTVLILIVTGLTARGLAVLAPDLWRTDLSYAFKLWSSVAVLILAACFAVGTFQAWPALSLKDPVL